MGNAFNAMRIADQTVGSLWSPAAKNTSFYWVFQSAGGRVVGKRARTVGEQQAILEKTVQTYEALITSYPNYSAAWTPAYEKSKLQLIELAPLPDELPYPNPNFDASKPDYDPLAWYQVFYAELDKP